MIGWVCGRGGVGYIAICLQQLMNKYQVVQNYLYLSHCDLLIIFLIVFTCHAL